MPLPNYHRRRSATPIGADSGRTSQQPGCLNVQHQVPSRCNGRWLLSSVTSHFRSNGRLHLARYVNVYSVVWSLECLRLDYDKIVKIFILKRKKVCIFPRNDGIIYKKILLKLNYFRGTLCIHEWINYMENGVKSSFKVSEWISTILKKHSRN